MTGHPIAKLLRGVRAGETHLAWNHPTTATAPDTITVSSAAFGDGAAIPQRHAGTGVGDNVSPQLTWDGVPPEAVELVLIVEDPDAPLPRPFVHCVTTGIDPFSIGLDEGGLSGSGSTESKINIGKGSMGQAGYGGPRPVPGHGPHRYLFQMFALDEPTRLGPQATKKVLLESIRDHVIARGRLTGTYERS